MRFLKLLKPDRRGILLFVLLLVVHAVLVHWFGTVTYSRGTTETRIGYGPLVIRQSVKECIDSPSGAYRTSTTVNWHWVLLILVVTYLVANLVGHGITRLVPRKKPRFFLTQVFGGGFVLAIVAASICSKHLWGYCVAPPPVDSRIAGAEEVVSLTPVSTQEDADGNRIFVVDPDYFIVKSGDTSRGGYYALEQRPIYALEDRGKLRGTVLNMSSERVAPLYSLVASTGSLYPGEVGYETAQLLSGIVIEAEGRRGEHLLLIAVAGNQVSNDHYPYYEFLFLMPQGGEPRLLACDRWFYDNAGVEFLSWPFLFILFFVPATLVALLVVDIIRPVISALWRAARRRPAELRSVLTPDD